VPRIENQVSNDLAQVASGYKVSKQKLQELIKIKDKLVPLEYPSMGIVHDKTYRGTERTRFLQSVLLSLNF